MKIAIFGLWHLGSVTAACTAAAGVRTIGIDLDRDRIARLSAGEPPLYEPGLAELVRSSLATGVLAFSAEPSAVRDADIVWICYDTPVDEQDQADALVEGEIELLFPHLKDGAVVLVSAQLPVGSVAALETRFAQQAHDRSVSFACSSENLRLGQAVEVFRNPGRIVVGVREDARVQAFDPNVASLRDDLRDDVRLCTVMVGKLVLDPGRFLPPEFAAEKRLWLVSVGRIS
jgi:UDPglucose 6-dehydrogenase